MSIQERFSKVLKRCNKSASNLAVEINVSHSAIGNVLKGNALPSSKILIPLGDKFNININWLLLGTGKMFIDPSNADTKNILEEDYSKVKELEKEIKYLKQYLKDK